MREAIFSQAYPLALRSVSARTWGLFLNAADREDAEQNVALGVWLALSCFNPARGSLRTFVERVVHNQLVSFLRCESNRPRWHEPIEDIELLSAGDNSRVENRIDIERATAAFGRREAIHAGNRCSYPQRV